MPPFVEFRDLLLRLFLSGAVQRAAGVVSSRLVVIWGPGPKSRACAARLFPARFGAPAFLFCVRFGAPAFLFCVRFGAPAPNQSLVRPRSKRLCGLVLIWRAVLNRAFRAALCTIIERRDSGSSQAPCAIRSLKSSVACATRLERAQRVQLASNETVSLRCAGV